MSICSPYSHSHPISLFSLRMVPILTVQDVMLFLTTRQHDNEITTIEEQGETGCDTLSSSAATTTTMTTMTSSAVQPSIFPLFDTDTQSNSLVKTDRAQSNVPVKLDRAQSNMRPPLFPLFDNDTDDDNDDCADNSGGGSSSGGGRGSSGDGDRHNPLVLSTKITEQTTTTALRLFFQLAPVRMRQVNPSTLH